MVRDEDLIVKILSENSIEDYYRFYGARHSIIQLGYLIDFEKETSSFYLPRLRRVSHIPFPWLFQKNKLFWWQNFITLLKPHFKDISKLDTFYFQLLLESAKKWEKQNPKRVIIESIIKMLAFEGILPNINQCFICHQKIENKIAFIPPLKAVHPECCNMNAYKTSQVIELFNNFSTLFFEDSEIEALYPIIVKAI